MHAKLFRSLDYPDLRWCAIGPSDHCRAAFNLIDLVGFAPVKQRTREEQDRLRDWSGGPPYKIYSPYKWIGAEPDPDKRYTTVPAAKRAARAFVMGWLKSASEGPLIWETSETGCHFHAMVPNGPHVGHIFYCTEEGKGFKPGFRVWFGGTYYVVDFANPDEAREAVQETWLDWLRIARDRFLSQNTQG